MPTVARYGGRKVETVALPGARLTAAETPDSEGFAVAQAGERQAETVGQVGGAAFRLGAEEAGKAAQEGRDYADTIADLNAKRQLGTWENTAVYDPTTGALQKKGKDALGLPEQIRTDYDKVSSDIAAGLTNDRQRVRFQAYAIDHGIALDHQINQHVASEMQRYGANELEGFLDNSRNRAILQASVPVPAGSASTLPQMVGNELAQQEAAIRNVGGKLGMGPEQLTAAIAKTRSETHVGVIQNLLATEQTKNAQAYFDETIDQIDPAQRKRLADALKEGHVRKDAQTAADQILATGGTLTEQRAKAKAIDDPDVRDAALQYLEHENALQEHAAQEAEKGAARGAYNILDATKGDLTRIPPTTWQGFDGGLRSALTAYSEHLARGTPIQTNDATYYTLLKAAAETPQDFAKTNLLRYRPYLDDAAFNHVIGVQTAILWATRRTSRRPSGRRSSRRTSSTTRSRSTASTRRRSTATPRGRRRPRSRGCSARASKSRRASQASRSTRPTCGA